MAPTQEEELESLCVETQLDRLLEIDAALTVRSCLRTGVHVFDNIEDSHDQEERLLSDDNSMGTTTSRPVQGVCATFLSEDIMDEDDVDEKLYASARQAEIASFGRNAPASCRTAPWQAKVKQEPMRKRPLSARRWANADTRPPRVTSVRDRGAEVAGTGIARAVVMRSRRTGVCPIAGAAPAAYSKRESGSGIKSMTQLQHQNRLQIRSARCKATTASDTQVRRIILHARVVAMPSSKKHFCRECKSRLLRHCRNE
ncbi:unnamed protein product [Amoebophrya sp. A25]|nr:unnamed protein product [Amoebophrya sp. A25]|eukprot:GSA25T00000692001.1